MSDTQNIQWFPGHMAKTRRLIKESLPLVDAVVEIIDARIPRSSRNPEIDKLIGAKPRVVILNKADIADNAKTKLWLDYFNENNIQAMSVDLKSGKGLNGFLPLLKTALSDLIEKRKQRGIAGKPIRIMIVGIPNVGKSSFINKMAKSKRAKVEDRPGVTRGRQWVTLSDGTELLDMAGVLWPKFEDKDVGIKLAFTGAIKDNILDTEELSMKLVSFLHKFYPELLKERFKIEPDDDSEPYDLLCKCALNRGMIISKGEPDTERAAAKILDEFRSGTLGRITLELPPRFRSDDNV